MAISSATASIRNPVGRFSIAPSRCAIPGTNKQSQGALMPHATIDGLRINYVVKGNGPPLIMLSPGGFDSNIDGWSERGVWKDLRPLETPPKNFAMIAYDRREPGHSGGRVEPHTWRMWAAEAIGLLDH